MNEPPCSGPTPTRVERRHLLRPKFHVGTTYPFVYGSVVQKYEYDYGSGNPGSLVRQTNSQFQWQVNGAYITANLLDRVSSTTAFDGGSHQLAQTTYGYDENNGSPQGVYGNQTSVTRWLNTGTSPKTQYVYDSNGMRTKMIDPLNYQTLYTYDGTGMFLNQVQYPNTGSINAH